MLNICSRNSRQPNRLDTGKTEINKTHGTLERLAACGTAGLFFMLSAAPNTEKGDLELTGAVFVYYIWKGAVCIINYLVEADKKAAGGDVTGGHTKVLF